MKISTIGARIKKLRKTLGLTQQQVADRLKLTKGSISQWEADNSAPKGSNLVGLCDVLKTTPSYLLYGDQNLSKIKEENQEYKPFHRDLPVVSYVQAGDADVVLDLADSDEAKKVRTYKKCSDKSYALEISGDSMTANSGRYSFPEGDYIAVDPEQRGDTTNGIFVVAKEVGRDAVNFKQLKYEGSTPYLNPLNDKFDKYFGEFIILGKVFDHIPKDMP